MKKSIIKITLSVVLLMVLILYSGCEEEPSEYEVAMSKITAHTWKISNVTVDGTTQTQLFTNFSIKFNNNDTYTSSNGAPVWPGSGQWYLDVSGTAFSRSDNGLMVSIQELSETSLILSLQWNRTTFGNGKTESISGNHRFTFTK